MEELKEHNLVGHKAVKVCGVTLKKRRKPIKTFPKRYPINAYITETRARRETKDCLLNGGNNRLAL